MGPASTVMKFSECWLMAAGCLVGAPVGGLMPLERHKKILNW